MTETARWTCGYRSSSCCGQTMWRYPGDPDRFQCWGCGARCFPVDDADAPWAHRMDRLEGRVHKLAEIVRDMIRLR